MIKDILDNLFFTIQIILNNKKTIYFTNFGEKKQKCAAEAQTCTV